MTGGHAGLDGLQSRWWQDLPLLVQLFSQKPPYQQLIEHIRLLPILFIISQWVYQMIIQAHLGIIMALLEVMLDWMD
jgi:hypothetical protein